MKYLYLVNRFQSEKNKLMTFSSPHNLLLRIYAYNIGCIHCFPSLLNIYNYEYISVSNSRFELPSSTFVFKTCGLHFRSCLNGLTQRPALPHFPNLPTATVALSFAAGRGWSNATCLHPLKTLRKYPDDALTRLEKYVVRVTDSMQTLKRWTQNKTKQKEEEEYLLTLRVKST